MINKNLDFIKKFDLVLYQSIKSTEQEVNTVEIISTQNGLNTLQVRKGTGSLYLHSKYNPIQEAERIISRIDDLDQYDHIFFYGIGLGYHIHELLNRYPHKKFSMFEPNMEVFKLFLQQKDITNLPTQNLSFLKVGLREEELKSFIIEFFNHVQEKTLLVTLPSYERFLPEEYKDFVEQFKTIVEEKRHGILINYSFQKRWTLNSWINLPETIQTLNILQGINKEQFKNKPAIIVSAGPSLNDEIENLRIIKEKGLAYIFSVSSAINTLIDNNIYPDAMCTYDPTASNQVVFENVIKYGIDTIPMIYGTSVGYETLKNYKGPKAHMVMSQDTISNYYLKSKNNKGIIKLNDAPSIAVVVLQLLYKLGCNPIILVGQNFAYKDNQFYSKGQEYKTGSNFLTENQIKKAVKVKDVMGNDILSSELFNRMREQFEYYLSKGIKDVQVINTTKGGAHIEGTTFVELSDLLKNNLTNKEVVKDWLKIEQNKYDFKYLKEKKNKMQNEYDSLAESLKKVKKLFNKMEQLMIERKVVKLEKMFEKFDLEMKSFVQNNFYLTFLQPMNRVEFDLLTKSINSLKFEKDIITKSKKIVNSFKQFVNSCEFDLRNMKLIFEEVNKEIEQLLKESDVKDVSNEER